MPAPNQDNGWIRIKDRKPIGGGAVLVLTEARTLTVGYLDSHDKWYTDLWGNDMQEALEYWMPFPEFPR